MKITGKFIVVLLFSSLFVGCQFVSGVSAISTVFVSIALLVVGAGCIMGEALTTEYSKREIVREFEKEGLGEVCKYNGKWALVINNEVYTSHSDVSFLEDIEYSVRCAGDQLVINTPYGGYYSGYYFGYYYKGKNQKQNQDVGPSAQLQNGLMYNGEGFVEKETHQKNLLETKNVLYQGDGFTHERKG